MKQALKIPLIWAGIYILVEITLVMLNVQREQTSRFIGFGANTLCLLLAIGISVIRNFNRLKHQGVSIIADLKTGIRTGVIYALLISSFLFSYYKWIDPTYTESIKQQYLAGIEAEGFDQNAKEVIEENPDMYYGQSVDDLRDNAQTNIEQMLSVKTVFPISLMSLILLSIFYSFIVTGFNRLVLSQLR